MLFSTNKIQPKPNHRFDKYLEEEKDKDGNLTGNVISSIPKNVFTTSQERVKNRPARALPHKFPGVRIVQQRKPEMIFMQTSDLEDMRRKAENEKRKALMAKRVVNEKRKKLANRIKATKKEIENLNTLAIEASLIPVVEKKWRGRPKKK